MAFERVLLIANPIAGRGAGRMRAEALARGLRDAGLDVRLFFTEARGNAREQASRLAETSDADVVVVVGGDGTVGEVLSGLPASVPLAIHPMGTANVLAVDLGLPQSVEGTVELLRSGRPQPLDLATVNGTTCFLVVGVGFDGAAVQDVEARRRGPIRKWTYVRAALHTLWTWKEPRLSVELDGKALPGTFGWVLVSNLIGYGGILKLWPGRVLDDGQYEVFLFEKGTRLALLRYALVGMLRGLPGRTCTMIQARRVRITSDRPIPFEVDGDFGGTTPVDLRVGEQRTLILPSTAPRPKR